MNMPNADVFARAMICACDAVMDERERLDQLDAVVGDGEHGTNMCKCFGAVKEMLSRSRFESVIEETGAIGRTLLSSGGGTAATLIGMLFSYAAMNAAKNSSMPLVDVVRASYNAVKERSKAKVGDKTMIDALEPAMLAFFSAMDQDKALDTALQAAADAAHAGAESTKGMIAHRGRGLYAGERARGVLDPGAVSVSIILKKLAAVLTNNQVK